MEQQQINLYQPEIKKEEDQFSFSQMTRYWLWLLIGLVLLTFIETYRHYSSQAELKKLAKVKEEVNKQLSLTAKEAAITGSKEELQKEIESLQKKQALENAMIEKLKQVETGAGTGFSKYLNALSEQTVIGVWLTGFSLKDRGQVVTLEGRATAPVLVPQMIANLSQEDVFKGKTFQVFKLSIDEKTSEVNFVLQGKSEKNE